MGLAVALFYKRHFDIRNLTDIKHMLEICEMDQNIVIQSDYIYAQKAKKNWS